MARSIRRARRRTLGALALFVWLAAAESAPAAGRERAVQEIPELMGRILESQEEIRQQEGRFGPIIQGYNEQLEAARGRAQQAGSEEEATAALVEYVEIYAARLDAQDEGLEAVRAALVRMRADAKELERAAATAGRRNVPVEGRRAFFEDQFQGVAAATSALAQRLGRVDEIATTGAVLEAAWAVHGAQGISLPEMGPESAAAFARRVEGLYAQYQARANQLRVERRAVGQLLDLVIERQLGRQLDDLFAGSRSVGLGALLSTEGKSEEWNDLGQIVSRVLGMPGADEGLGGGPDPALDRLDYFGQGLHRREEER